MNIIEAFATIVTIAVIVSVFGALSLCYPVQKNRYEYLRFLRGRSNGKRK